MKLKAIIIDDEPYVRDDLRAMLAAHKDIEVSCEAGTIAEAKTQLAATSFDVVFLDIQLRGGTGFDLLPFIDPSAQIVFITAHDEYAVRAFEINALDYILKPVSADRLAESIARLKLGITPKEARSERFENFKLEDSVFIRTDSGRMFVRLDEIIAIASIGGNYASLNLKNGRKLISRKTLKDWEVLLPDPVYLRIHRSTIINTGLIERITHTKDGSSQVYLTGLTNAFEVSRRMASRLKSLVAATSLPARSCQKISP
jgi:two-component system LytT family response regulator